MVENTDHDSELDGNPYKGFFSIRTNIAELREGLSFSSLAMLSYHDLYDLLIEFIQLIKFVRQNQDKVRNFSFLNPGMKETKPSADNVGGLIPVQVKENIFVPTLETEILTLDLMNLMAIRAKNKDFMDLDSNFSEEYEQLWAVHIHWDKKNNQERGTKQNSKTDRHFKNLRLRSRKR